MAQPNAIPLENHLQRISRRFISIENDVNIAFRRHFDNVSLYLIIALKHRDPLFKKMFQMLQNAGSYADGIKVEAPNEFDVLVLLKFPSPIPVSSHRPGYVTINITNGLNTWSTWIGGDGEKYKRFIDSEGYLIKDQILDWLRVLVRGILSEHRNIFQIDGVEYEVRQKNCGPAVTIEVDVRRSSFGGIGYFSIDFVAALQFQSNGTWVADRRPILQIPRFWNAIPKPNRSQLHRNREWICSYAEIERDYLNGLNTIKPLIRIFKKIRDKAELSNLKSYYIKTIFLHHRLNREDSYWNRSLAVLFMEMFDVILNHLRSRELLSLWHHNYNLLSQFEDRQIDDIYNKLWRIKETITRNLVNNNPDIIYGQILTSTEMRAMEEKEKLEEEKGWCTIL